MTTLTGTLLGGALALQTKALPPLTPLSGRGGWWTVIRESFSGAWQRNMEVRADNVLTNAALFACVTLIASDIGKICLNLVQEDDDGIWTETENPAYSPVLRKPNRYQTIVKFIEQWMVSKLVHGNTYVLKERDQRRVVVALYILDPTRVVPLVAADGAVYYELKRDDLSELPQETRIVPASEIIHDTMVPLFHPLIGVSPIFACGVAALQAGAMQANSQKFFTNMSLPSGMLSAPGAISDETAARLKATFEANFGGDNIGRLLVGGDGLEFKAFSMTAVDAQFIEQLKWTGENVCTAYKVPPYMIGIGPPPPYANIEPLIQQYYNGCLQSLIVNFEHAMDEGLGLGPSFGNRYGTEFDLDDLIWMNAETRSKVARESLSGGLSPNEARKKYFGLGAVDGGEVPFLQEQNWPITLLASRTAPPGSQVAPPAAAAPAATTDDEPVADDEPMAASWTALLRKELELAA